MSNKTKFKKYRVRVAWAMIYSPDEWGGKSFWKASLYPTDKVLAQMRADGIQAKVKSDDGSKSGVQGDFITVRRDTEKDFGSGMQPLMPVPVDDKDGKKLVSYEKDDRPDAEFPFVRHGEPVLIGNGSECEVTLEVYPTRSFGKQVRLNRIKILDLVEYNPDGSDEKEEPAEQNSGKAPESKTKFDDLPF